jgi:transposase-like protein
VTKLLFVEDAMNPHPLFCPNIACPSRGQCNEDNIRPHDSLRNRWRCRTCKKTFSGRQGTPFYGLKTDEATVLLVITLLAGGCPLQAIVTAFGFDERTVKDWQDKAGAHCERVHAALVTAQTMDLGQVQADEVRVKLQRRLVVWMAMAICVPTRLWLGGVAAVHRDKKLLLQLAAQIKACARFGPLLLVTDGLKSYVGVWQRTFRTPVPSGGRGRPCLLAWPDLVIGQMVKRYQKGRVVGIEQRLLQGTLPQLAAVLAEENKISTAYIERLNATFRARLCCLTRRGRALARLPKTVQNGMYLVGCLYNFCTPHKSLSVEGDCTPAMAAGLTQWVWLVGELLWYRVPPPPFVHDKRRGRRPKTQVSETKGGKQLVTV